MRFTEYLDEQPENKGTMFAPSFTQGAGANRFLASEPAKPTGFRFGASFGLNGNLSRTNDFYKGIRASIGGLSSAPQSALRFSPSTDSPTLGSVSGWLSSLGGFGSTAPPPAGVPGGGVGTATALGGDWSGVDQWNSAIQNAANAEGVPVNLIKAVMKLESGGANLAPNGDTAVGPMQVTINNWGNLGFDLYDPAQNIQAGARILKQEYSRCGTWEGAVNAYYSGGCQSTGARDNPANGGSGMTDYDYVGQIIDTYHSLGAAPGQMFAPGTTGGSGAFNTAFGGQASVPEWGEFGAESGNGLYAYGRDYGMSGTQHTGVDVPGTLNQPLYAPMSGVVTCAGTGNGSGTDGGGCAAFNDYFGSGAGRIELLLDNGAVLIFGHSSQARVSPGQRVDAGTMIGTMGGMNSIHTHLEARVRDASMPSGWRIVDPRQVLGGLPGAPITGGGSFAAPPVANGGWMPRVNPYWLR